MASIQRHGRKWRVQVYVAGKRESAVHGTKQEAAAWALQREAELSGAQLPERTLTDAMRRYATEVSPGKGGERWEVCRLKAVEKTPLGARRLSTLTTIDFAAWRDARNRKVMPSTTAREMNLLSSVLEVARRDWGWLHVHPMRGVRWPTSPASRKRRVTDAEIELVTAAFDVATLGAASKTQRVGLAFLFALETAMRSGEILALRWEDVHLKARYVHVAKSKNGDERDVPLTTRAAEILQALPRDTPTLFEVDDKSRDALWRKYLPEQIVDLHFHDTRAEGIWRLSKKLDVLQLARAVGHRDIRNLMIYYNESAADMAKRLD